MDRWLQFIERLSPAAQKRISRLGPPASVDRPAWHVVVVPDAGEPMVHTVPFQSDRQTMLDELQTFLRSVVGKEIFCYVFYGHTVPITAGSPHRLLLPGGGILPLLPIPTVTGEAEVTHYLGIEVPIETTPLPTAAEEEAEYETIEEGAEAIET